MKENTESKENPEYIFNGHSGPAGVYFCCDDYAAFASRDAKGQIKVISGSEEEIKKKMKETEKKYPLNLLLFIFFPLFIALGILHVRYGINHNWSGWWIAGAVIFWLPSWYLFTSCCACFFPIYKSKESLLQYKRYHGAEHKVYNAYHKDHEIPNVQTAKPYSVLCPACGCAYVTGMLFFMAVAGTLVAFLPKVGFLKALLVLVALVVYLIAALGGFIHRHPFMLAEIKATAQPTDQELEVACAAFETAYNLKDKERFQPENTKENDA